MLDRPLPWPAHSAHGSRQGLCAHDGTCCHSHTISSRLAHIRDARTHTRTRAPIGSRTPRTMRCSACMACRSLPPSSSRTTWRTSRSSRSATTGRSVRRRSSSSLIPTAREVPSSCRTERASTPSSKSSLAYVHSTQIYALSLSRSLLLTLCCLLHSKSTGDVASRRS